MFGWFMVLRRVENLKPSKHRRRRSLIEQYMCVCRCGKYHKVRGESLRYGGVKSCGCSHRGKVSWRKYDIGCGHGTLEHALWEQAKRRATVRHLAFTLRPSDIKIPARCPLLGVALERAGRGPNHPSLDRKDSQGGYTPENVWVISYRANTIKNNATLDEFEQMAIRWRASI